MSIENIERKIAQSAKDEADRIVADAKKAAAERIESAKAEQHDRAEDAERETTRKLQQALDRAATSARAANKLKLLARKSELLDEIFEQAVERFIGDRTGDYADWLAAQVESVAKADGTLVPAEPDRDAIGKLLGKGGPELADESLPLRGGFVVRGEHIDEDRSLDARLGDLKAALLPELAKKALATDAHG